MSGRNARNARRLLAFLQREALRKELRGQVLRATELRAEAARVTRLAQRSGTLPSEDECSGSRWERVRP